MILPMEITIWGEMEIATLSMEKSDSCRVAVHLPYVTPLRHVHKLVDQALPIYLSQDPSLVVVPECPAHRLVVHVGLVLVHPPQPRYRLAVHQLEHTLFTVAPFDELGTALRVLEQFKEKLPEVGCRPFSRLPLTRRTIRTNLASHLLLFDFEGVLVGGKGGRVERERMLGIPGV